MLGPSAMHEIKTVVSVFEPQTCFDITAYSGPQGDIFTRVIDNLPCGQASHMVPEVRNTYLQTNSNAVYNKNKALFNPLMFKYIKLQMFDLSKFSE